MAGVALGLAGPGLELVAKSKRALSSAPSSSSASCVSCSASYSSSHVRPQKALVLRSSFVARTTHSSFWDGGVGPCVLALAVEGSIKQSKRGGALCAQANIFERVVRIVRSYANAIVSSAEDPEKLLDQTVLEMNEDLIKMRQASAQVLASQKQLENKYKATQTAADDWYRRAKLALEKGDEVLAREALKRRKDYEESAKALKSQLDPQKGVVEKLISNTRGLAGIFIGSALLVVSLGLGFARPVLARPSTVEISSNVELDSEATTALVSSPSQPTKEEDPAELVLLSYLERHSEDVKALEGLMYIRLRKGSVAKALETVEKLLALRPDHAPWQLVRAQALEFQGDLDEARHAFELILEKDPLSARALQGLATVMSKAGEGTEMLDMLRRAMQTAMEAGKTKEVKNLRMLLGQMYTLEGILQEALAQYQELEREDPRDFRPYLCQGLVYSLLNQKQDAERAFLKYRRRCPKSFPERGYLDDLMIGAKTEARKIQVGERLQPEGKKKSKPLQQPNINTAVAENFDEEE